MSPLFIDLTDQLSSSHPHSVSLVFYLSPSTWPPPAPEHYPHLSFLLLPFLAISSPHPSVMFIFTRVMLLENVPREEMTGNRRQWCLAGFSVCSQGTGKAPLRVLTPQGCAVKWRDDKRGMCWGTRKATRESASATVAVALGFLDAETCWEVTHVSRV